MADAAPSRPSALSRVHPVVWVLIALAVPAFLELLSDFRGTREYKLEQAAIQQLLTIQTAQTRYASQFGRFATNLNELGPTAAGLIPGDLAKGVKTGYQFSLIGTPTCYTINASPVKLGTTGRRTLFSDQSNVIREHWGPEPATVNSPEIPGSDTRQSQSDEGPEIRQ
ncbi:MAG TPA: hypothetical protein VN893_00160 [Bryobacteraceae bacterium]|nr:hypothetical protein [Bryobacteraceae bacterium]